MKMKMTAIPPRHVCIAGALLLAVGVDTVIEIISGFLAGDVSFDLGFISIFIGIGVLQGKESSRCWAVVLSIAGLLILMLVWILSLFGLNEAGGLLYTTDRIYFGVQIVVLLVTITYIPFSLTRQPNREWFQGGVSQNEDLRNLIWAVVAITVFLRTTTYATLWWMEKSQEQIFIIDHTIVPFNAETGEGLDGITYGSGPVSSGDTFPKVSMSTGSTREGARVSYRGLAMKPFEVRLSSDGFEEVTVRIDKDTEDPIRVGLTPLNVEPSAEKEDLSVVFQE